MSELMPYVLPAPAKDAMRMLVETIAPPGQARALGLVEKTVEDTILTLRTFAPPARNALRVGLIGFEMGALARYRKRASRLNDAQRLSYYESWKHGTLIQNRFIQAIKGVIGLNYYEQPEVRAKLSYHPEQWVEKVTQDRLRVFQEPIQKHEASMFERDPIPLPSEVEAAVAASEEADSTREVA